MTEKKRKGAIPLVQLETAPDPQEAAMRAALNGLVEIMYRKKRAAEILESFDAALSGHAPSERLSILEHWLDFYRLRRYQGERRRQRPTIKQRVLPCAACGYPASHRHHLWDYATHGENKVTIQLCANCHELQHLIYNALVKDSDHSRQLALHLMSSGRLEPETVRMILGWCVATIRYEATQGWVDGGRAAEAHVENVLRWSDYVKQKQ